MNTSNSSPKPLFIKDLIRRVHQELLESQEERLQSGLQPIFALEKLTIEVNFVITQADEVRGGLDFKIINAGGGEKYEEQQIHKIVLSLTALGPSNTQAEDSDAFLEGFDTNSARILPRKEIE